jgi:hypothetical protein
MILSLLFISSGYTFFLIINKNQNMKEDFDFEFMKFQYGKAYLDDIFSTMVDAYPHIHDAHVSGQINLWELLQKIKYNVVNDIDFNILFTYKYVNGKKNDDYEKIKDNLPTVCYNASFNRYKNSKNIISTTNLMFLDIDDFKTKEEVLSYKSHITLKYDWIIACNLSLSRLGLHIIIKVDKINDNDDFNRKYDFINEEYFEGRLDKNSKSLTRFTVVPYDYNIYINETPNILNIEQIISNHEKGILSGYKEKKIISTTYTFSCPSQLNATLNDAAWKDKLMFRQELDETLFTDPNIPIYYPEGIDVMSVNLYQYRDRKVREGMRTVTIGGITVRMIYLNAQLPQRKDPEIRDAILKCIININKDICEPRLTYKEVLMSFNANWKKYEDDELDFSRYFTKQRSFWSKECTLKGDEKRKISCKIKNKPIVAESRKMIANAIEYIHFHGNKITQKNVALCSGLKLPTVKKYWKEFKLLVNE